MCEGSWTELGEDVYARRYEELDLTVGLVVGADTCLVIDTRGDVDQGRELATAVRQITDKPWSVVYTHAHFDHCFGTIAFLPCDVWAHEGCSAELRTSGANARKHHAGWYRELGKPEIAEALERTTIELPDQLVSGQRELNLGGRRAVLVHPGPAHTDHDLLVHLPDEGIVFAGDVVEHGPHGFTAESFVSGTDLLGWPAALDVILALDTRLVVPGHGAPVDREFLAGQQKKLAELVRLHAAVYTGALSESEAVIRSAYPADVTLAALALRPRADPPSARGKFLP